MKQPIDNFTRAISFVLKWEGGYVNDPADPGGKTKYGISKRYHPKVDIKALTEKEAADGSTATPEQMLYMIWSLLSDFSISGTTYTAKKLDGATVAMTFTLDDGTAPTAMNRAT